MSGRNSAPTDAQVAGRGVLWLTGAKFYFMLSGMALLLALPAIFKKFYSQGHVELYGDFRTIMGLVNWFNMILIAGTIQTVSKFVSEKPGRTDSVKWNTIKLQAAIGGLLSLVLLLGAPIIAGRFYDDPGLTSLLRMSAPIVILYGFYAAVIGCMNGLKRFKHQAMMDIMFATLKVGLTIGLVAAGLALQGAMGAFLITAVIMLAVSWLLLGREKGEGDVSWKDILSFEWKTLLVAFLLNGVLQIDLQLLKALAPEALGTSSTQTGIYGGALQIGQLPYVATLSVAFVIFPLISRSTFQQDRDKTLTYISTTNRYSLMTLAGLAVVLATNARGILNLIYPEEYLEGARLLAILAVGYSAFALTVINTNIFTAAGNPLQSVALFAITLGTSALLNYLLIPQLGSLGAAISASSAMGLGLLLSVLLSIKRFGVFCPWKNLLRMGLAVAATWFIGRFLPQGGKLMVIVSSGIQFAAYWIFLILLRELSKNDLNLIKAVRR